MVDKSGGFTLVEIVVTIAIVGIAAAAINSIFISIRNIQVQATYLDSATRAAQREIESLRNDNYDSLSPGTVSFTSQLPSSLPNNKAGMATISQPATDLIRVDATVTYNSDKVTHTVTLSSYIGAIGITQ